jgi:subtilisin family serine protease
MIELTELVVLIQPERDSVRTSSLLLPECIVIMNHIAWNSDRERKYMNRMTIAGTIAFLLASLVSGSGAQTTARLEASLQSAVPGNSLTVWIYFTDKGNRTFEKLSMPGQLISPRSLQRRGRIRPADQLVDATDLPVEQTYIDQVAAATLHVRQVSKWLNAVSAVATLAQIRALSGFPFVRTIDLLMRYGAPPRENPVEIEHAVSVSPAAKAAMTTSLAYGPSLVQDSLENIPAVHAAGNCAQTVLIGLFDNGFRLLSHQAFDFLRSRIIATYDFVDHKVSVAPDNPSASFGSHGINTLSTIAGYAPGQLIGPAYGASFVLARTENDSSETPVEEDNWARAIEWADSLGIDVASTSLGYLTYDAPYTSWTWSDMDGKTTVITRAADMAVAKGIIVVNSAGNDAVARAGQPNTLIAPADGDSVLTAGAVNAGGIRASFSSYGPTADGRIKPDVMAMGVNVYTASASSPTGYSVISGTSFSCPLTAGIAALVLNAFPKATPMEIVGALKATASNAGSPDDFNGWGIVNAKAAIDYLARNADTTKEPFPHGYSLGQNYPNPFNPGTRIEFVLPEASTVELTVYDILGRKVRTLVQGNYPTSTGIPYHVMWDATDQSGRRVASGVYIYRLSARGTSGIATSLARTMLLLQ